MRLDEESSKLTTMTTPYGRYRWKRLPFALKVSSEIFQERLNDVLADIDGVFTVADDIIILGRGQNQEEAEKDHKTNLEALRRCEEKQIKLNEENIKIKKD